MVYARSVRSGGRDDGDGVACRMWLSDESEVAEIQASVSRGLYVCKFKEN
jgi:hypothetical protein